MQIKRRKSGKNARTILIAMITNASVLSRIAARWEGKLFKSEDLNLIAKWCVQFYKKYNKAPGRKIELRFESWAEKTKNEDLVELVATFLQQLNDEYEHADEVNVEYVLDLADHYFNEVRYQELADSIKTDLDRDKLQDAEDRLQQFRRIDLSINTGIDVLQDEGAIREAIESKKKATLIEYSGPLGRFFGDSLSRDSFIAFEGPEKRGKSFWLLDIAWRGMLQRRKVAFFEVGDMTRNQIMLRFMERATHIPARPQLAKWPKQIITPDSDEDDDEDEDNKKKIAKVIHTEKEFTKSFNTKAALKACQKIMRRDIRSDDSYLRLSCHPAASISVSGIRSQLEEWARDDWVADIVVVDYADILAADYRAREKRDTINETWIGLRGLSQSLHCLVVTATQSSARAYKARSIGMEHFADDKRKRGHTTGTIGLNQTPHEKKIDLMRLGWVAERSRYFQGQVYVAGCRAISHISVLSSF